MDDAIRWGAGPIAAGGAAMAAVLALSSPAAGSGLYFSERGVRPLGRGGAFIAGADDLGAIWHNPAGIYDAGSQILVDASWLHFTADYTRQGIVEQVDPNTGQVVARFEQSHPTVQGVAPVMPIPTLALSYQLHPEWVLAFGLEAPYAAITSFPDSVNGRPAPQRHALITLDGSLLSMAGLWAAYAPTDEWRFGLGVEVLFGRFVSTQVLSGCPPDRFICAPEAPEWEILSQVTAGPIFSPSANLGAQWLFHPGWRAGMAFQLPFWVRAPADLQVRLPSTPMFERAYLEGSDADIAFELPWSLRLGVEWEPIENLRVELAGVFEGWSIHDEITIDPDGMAMREVVGFPDPFFVPEVNIPRNFRDTGAVRLGGEYLFEAFGVGWEPRLGVGFESSAIPTEYLSATTVDLPKLTVGVGLGLHIDSWRFDVVYAHVFGFDVEVDPDEAAVPIQTPMAAYEPDPYTINGGLYQARANVLGAGLRYEFDVIPPLGREAEDEEPAAPAP
ncbi:MAG: outer membrane protein transport protein [Deltaproteobacteria bacterium]|nr:outer membrane protein transport protein [Deltaproteobacteria bacterium]MBW2534408.1 outer membrane protein transport protein [Deltaproteobacteria bacterium]